MSALRLSFAALKPDPVSANGVEVVALGAPSDAQVLALAREDAHAAVELVYGAYKVRVYTARHGYDDPMRVYPKHEIINGVDVRRLPLASF